MEAKIEEKMINAINKIKEASVKRDNIRSQLLKKIEEKKERIQALFTIGNKLLECDYKLPSTQNINFQVLSYMKGYFTVHEIKDLKMDDISIIGNLRKSFDEYDINTLEKFVEKFVTEFDEFEKAVYDYVERL